MTGSFEKIDYRLRPAKHAERWMFCDIFRRMNFFPIEGYQYVGFGSVAFVDFRLFHRSLGISGMISIEKGGEAEVEERFRRNVPFSGIEMKFGLSSQVLPSIDFNRPSIVWLDYDDKLERSMATDLGAVCRTLASGSFLGATFSAPFPTDVKAREVEFGRLKSEFPEALADDANPKMMLKDGLALFGRSVLGGLVQRALSDADAGKPLEQQRTARQVCFFRYADGLPMVTVGWVIVSNVDLPALEGCRFGGLPFHRDGAEYFTIKMPLVTPLEISEMERTLPTTAEEMALNWIPLDQRNAFVKIYRYLPHFANFEPA